MDINFAIPEETRPPMYKALKYWGKKPHNIWAKYIKNYTKEGSIILDPFSGSAVASLEAVILNRKAVAIDLNPISSFIIEVFASDFDKEKFEIKVDNIYKKIYSSKEYQKYFFTKCNNCFQNAEVLCFRWNNIKNEIYEIGFICGCENNKLTKKIKKPDYEDIEKCLFNDLNLNEKFVPQDTFPNNSAFSNSFLNNLNSMHFKDLWTKRNLFILSKIMEEILNDLEINEDMRKQLLFALTQCLHLTTKMCVPRDSKEADRYFSTSWGRSAFLLANKSFEANSLIWFKRSALGKQSAKSSISNFKDRIQNRKLKIKKIKPSNKKINFNKYDITYGNIDAEAIDEYLKQKSIDFIITDPPYGDIVHYMSLSLVWTIWLKIYDKQYTSFLQDELIVDKNNNKTNEFFEQKLTSILCKMNIILKDNAKCILTFHSKDIKMWNTIIRSINNSGFLIEKVIWQQNLRTGESNVANPFGTSASDFYLRILKSKNVRILNEKDKYENLVIKKAIKIIAERNEPTPFDLLYNGILSELSITGYDLTDYTDQMINVLKRSIDKDFVIYENQGVGGNFWWLKEPDLHISKREISLSDRVTVTLKKLFKRKRSLSFDEILSEIYLNFPNGLTPSIKSVQSILNEIAYKGKESGSSKWYIKNKSSEIGSVHSEKIYKLLVLGNYKYNTFVGKREMSEKWNSFYLKDKASIKKIKESDKFLNMIDVIWFNKKNNEIKAIFEIENSTEFIKSINRSSHLKNVQKFMIIPDHRESELKRNLNDLFVKSFKDLNWSYLTYSVFENIYKIFSSNKNENPDIVQFILNYSRSL